jgi:hypothetical protein
MSSDDYQNKYTDFIQAINTIRFFMAVTSLEVSEFPKNLPSKSRRQIKRATDELLRNIDGSIKQARANGKTVTVVRTDTTLKDPVSNEIGSTWANLLATIISTHKAAGGSAESLSITISQNLTESANAQALVMTFAHLDAFIADTVRAACKTRPELLRSERKIEWATALEFDGKADLIEHLIERYTYEFGMSNISQKIALFRKQMGLKIPTEHIDIQRLESAEQIRHIIVHNGSRVSQEFVERTKRKDARIGERVAVSIEFVRQTIEEVTSLATTIFLEMSEKFFDAHELKLLAAAFSDAEQESKLLDSDKKITVQLTYHKA